MIVAFRDMAKDSPTKGDFIEGVGPWQDLGEGRPGQDRIRLLNHVDSWDIPYLGVECLPAGTFASIAYGRWEKSQEEFVNGV